MLLVRTVHDATDFAGSSGDAPDYADTVAGMWEDGDSRPEWCFVICDGPDRIGRIGYTVEPTTSDPSWLGVLPPTELTVFGLELPWGGDYLSVGRELVRRSIATIGGDVPEEVNMWVNRETHDHAAEREALAEDLGMRLFQEKQGFAWHDDGTPVAVGDRLTFRTVADVGASAFRAVMAPCGDDTHDRNDWYYWNGCGPANWAAQMMVYLDDDDAPMWLIGYDGDRPVGYIAVGSDEEWGSTIVHVGVLPEHRGHGFINDLLAAGTAAAQRAGITSMLSDVDVLNAPMVAAMRRAGHRDDVRPWRVRVYRHPVAAFND